MSHDSVIFTSWKEIASYLGKGIRTVQRWETEFGLPIHRPNTQRKGIVRASQKELDQWLAAHWSPAIPGTSTVSGSLKELESTAAALATQNAILKKELRERGRERERERETSSPAFRGATSKEVQLLLARCERLLNQTELMQREFAETLDLTRNLRALRALVRKKVDPFEWFRKNQYQ